MNLSLAASVHCFIVCIGRLLRPWNSILISHRPALRVGKSSARAGAADSKMAAITVRRRMACTPSQMRCAIISRRWNEESTRLDGDQIVVARPAAMNRERTAKHLLDGVEAVDQRKIFGHFAVAEAQEVRQPVADDAAILGAPAHRRFRVATWSPSTSIVLGTKQNTWKLSGTSRPIKSSTAALPWQVPQNGNTSTGPRIVHFTSSSRNGAILSMSRAI